jgi:hypothetical protein
MVHNTKRKLAQCELAQGEPAEAQPIGARLRKHCPRVTSGRKSLSCGFLLSPTWVGRACVLTDSCVAETRELIKTELFAHVKLIHNKTGNMYGTTRAKEFLPNFIGPEASKLKTLLQLRETEPYFYCEDHAPGHYHDNCSVTKETGLNEIRKAFFVETNGYRKLTPKRATPRFGVGDQIHGWIKDLIHKELARLGAMTDNDLTKMADISLLRNGGMFVTSKGYKRGATLFLYCLAVARVRAILMQKQYVVLAAFCKCGFYDIKDVHKLFKMKEEMVNSGVVELAGIQKELKDTHTWLDKKT